MDGNQFHYLKTGLESDGYQESKRMFLDWFIRSYIKEKCCPVCDHSGLEPIIMRFGHIKQSFGRCKHCGEVSRI